MAIIVILLIIGLCSFFIAKRFDKYLEKKTKPNAWTDILVLLVFIVSFSVLSILCTILSFCVGAFHRGGPNLDQSYLDTIKINSSRIDTLNKKESFKPK